MLKVWYEEERITYGAVIRDIGNQLSLYKMHNSICESSLTCWWWCEAGYEMHLRNKGQSQGTNCQEL